MEFVVITGMSGAGKTCVVDSLEDLEFFCIDNLPAKLIPVFAELINVAGEYKRVAVVTDIRSGASISKSLEDSLFALDEMKIPYRLMFIDADDDVLLHRFKETRRPHPMNDAENPSLHDAISRERELLKPFKSKADLYLYTGNLTASQCRARVQSMFSEGKNGSMKVHFMSFGYKFGIPSDADFVFDIRFLPNPFYVPELKTLTGLDDSVFNYIMQFPESQAYAEKLKALIDNIIPLCESEGRTQLVIGCGCTGGHHRSVTFARLLHDYFKSKGYETGISHRDILK